MAWILRTVGALVSGAALWMMLFESQTWSDVLTYGGISVGAFFVSWAWAAYIEGPANG